MFMWGPLSPPPESPKTILHQFGPLPKVVGWRLSSLITAVHSLTLLHLQLIPSGYFHRAPFKNVTQLSSRQTPVLDIKNLDLNDLSFSLAVPNLRHTGALGFHHYQKNYIDFYRGVERGWCVRGERGKEETQ